MLIEKNLTKYCVFDEDSIANALRKIEANRSHTVFCVTASQHLEGVVTDGDVRRWLIAQDRVDLGQPVGRIANRSCRTARAGDDPALIEEMLSDSVTMLPLLDAHGRLVSIAIRRPPGVNIGSLEIGEGQRCVVIAEIGNNHNGRIDLAKQLVDLAVDAGADCVKFQMRHMSELYRDAAATREDLGAEYTLDLLSRFNLEPAQLCEVFDHCRARGVVPLCTPWDLASVEALEAYGIEGYKIASADLTNHQLLEAIAATGKPVLLSTGMSTESEIATTVGLLKSHAVPLVLLHCNSTYPAPFKDVNLAYMGRLAKKFGVPVGYSGHERGFNVAVASVAMGARVLEKHFTIDRNMEGNDHKVSLLPGEFRQMVLAVRQVEEAMGHGGPRELSQGEVINREVLAKSLVAVRPVRKGEIVTADMLAVKSPGRGLQPNRRGEIIGRPARRDIAAHDFFYPSDVGEEAIAARPYGFRRPWGVPVRYHDVQDIAAATNLDLVEYHLSYKDLEDDLAACFPRPFELDFVVHCPEMFSGDMLLNLCSPDAAVRRRSIDELQRVADIARALRPYHRKAAPRTLIVTNVGGFSDDGPCSADEVARGYDLLSESLRQVDLSEVEVIPQTMPPFPWHFGGQRYHNLFVAGDQIARYCRDTGMRVCLDVSHSKLACNHFGWSFSEFLEMVGPYTAHLHLADAKGIDGEGLQIGEGDIDFGGLARSLDRTAPKASFIPEIWQGHKNGGEGFWVALTRLERWF